MRAIGLTHYGGSEVLEFVTVPDPQPRARDVVVRVRAAGVNPVDAKVRRGLRGGGIPAGAPLILGWDGAGVVESVGAEAHRFRPGDEVYFAGDLSRPGCYAERVAVDERIVGRRPRTISFEESAAIPLVAITAWESLFENMAIPESFGTGHSLLIVGGGGGVGSLAIQLAKKLRGLTVIATASRPDSIATCRKLGADHVIDHRHDLAAQLRELGFADGVDFIHTNAEQNDWAALGAAIKPLGRIGSILPARNADLSVLFQKRVSLHFEIMFARTGFGVDMDKQGALLDRVSTLLDTAVLVPPPTRVIDWKEARQAHLQIESTHTVGKLSLTIS